METLDHAIISCLAPFFIRPPYAKNIWILRFADADGGTRTRAASTASNKTIHCTIAPRQVANMMVSGAVLQKSLRSMWPYNVSKLYGAMHWIPQPPIITVKLIATKVVNGWSNLDSFPSVSPIFLKYDIQTLWLSTILSSFSPPGKYPRHIWRHGLLQKERCKHLAKVWKEFFFQGWALFFIYGLSFECNGLAVLLTLDPLGLEISIVRWTFMMDYWLA